VDEVDQAAKTAGLERWVNSSGGAIGMKRLSPTQPAAGRVLILYGNAGWTVGCAHYVNDLQKAAPFDVYIVEYPGYADRSGKPSEASVFHAADEAFELLETNLPVFLLGESLGTGVASHLAGKYPDQVAGLILLSPYDRLTGVAQHQVHYLPAWLLLVDRFPSEVYLRKYHGPVGISVDGQDRVVPEKFGLKLYAGYAGPKRLWRFPEGRHIAIGEPVSQFWREVLGFWQTSPPMN
jgi:pimeloyl-ACP methyl ester carboxylesterase